MPDASTTANPTLNDFIMCGVPLSICRNDGFSWSGEFFDVPAFEKERGVGPLTYAFPDPEFALADPAQ